MSSTQRSAIVTGASRGIGRAVAQRLAGDGFACVVNYAGNAAEAEWAVADLAAAVVFLVGPDGAWINGRVLRANGGMV